jgi:hypothetical protein
MMNADGVGGSEISKNNRVMLDGSRKRQRFLCEALSPRRPSSLSPSSSLSQLDTYYS